MRNDAARKAAVTTNLSTGVRGPYIDDAQAEPEQLLVNEPTK
jgi:hypothetical protein